MTMTILYLILQQGRKNIQLDLIKNEGMTAIFVILHFLEKPLKFKKI